MPSPKNGKAGTAVAPAGPEKALEADISNPGEVEKTKAEQRQAKVGKYGSVASVPYRPPITDEERALKKSWIEIELVDKKNKPVPGEAYHITLPDGKTVVKGTLDEKGFARVEGIEPGSCKITFPNLERPAWKSL